MMGSITKEVLTDANPDVVWDAIRDVGALHTRLVPGGRRVTFANGRIVEEPIVSSSDSLRRLVWTAKAADSPLTHYNGCVQVHARAAGGSRVEWTADFLPASAAPVLESMLNAGATAMRGALQARAVAPISPRSNSGP
jgi:hypothetical protein